MPEKHLAFSQVQVRQLQDHPQALPWAFLEKMTLQVLDRMPGGNLSPQFGAQVTHLVQAVAEPHSGTSAEPGASTTPAGMAQPCVQGVRLVDDFTDQVTDLGKLAKKGTGEHIMQATITRFLHAMGGLWPCTCD